LVRPRGTLADLICCTSAANWRGVSVATTVPFAGTVAPAFVVLGVPSLCGVGDGVGGAALTVGDTPGVALMGVAVASPVTVALTGVAVADGAGEPPVGAVGAATRSRAVAPVTKLLTAP